MYHLAKVMKMHRFFFITYIYYEFKCNLHPRTNKWKNKEALSIIQDECTHYTIMMFLNEH